MFGTAYCDVLDARDGEVIYASPGRVRCSLAVLYNI